MGKQLYGSVGPNKLLGHIAEGELGWRYATERAIYVLKHLAALLLVTGSVFSFAAPPESKHRDSPDKIFVNGKIWTGDDAHAIAEALAVRGDRLVGVGTNVDIRALAGPETAVLDLEGRLVVPGFNDAHWHFSARQHADLVDASTIDEIKKRLLEFAAKRPNAAWITGRGWGYAAFQGQAPDRKFLDEVLPNRPVFIWERDGHMGLANTKALTVAGITRETPNPPTGRIEHRPDGEPTGELKEAAVGLVTSNMPGLTAEDDYEALRQVMDLASSYGLTSLQEASAGLGSNTMEAFERLLAEGRFKTRFYVSIPLLKNPTLDELKEFKDLRSAFRGPVLKFGSAKGVLDGTIDAKTALMFEPYVGGATGIPMWTQAELDHAVQVYDHEGFQVWLHAIGDKAVHMALDSYEAAAKVNGTSGRRHRVEHVEVPHLSDLPRFRQLGVIASTQALFANPDATTLGNYAGLLGPERASHANAFRLFDQAGAVQAFGSDFPVFSMEVLRGIYCAVTRKTPEGTPPGGWYPSNRISVEAALHHFTSDAAYASFEENVKGTLAPGKLADFVVLSQDILREPPEQLLKTRVLLTVMGGREMFRAPEFQ